MKAAHACMRACACSLIASGAMITPSAFGHISFHDQPTTGNLRVVQREGACCMHALAVKV